MTQATSHKVEIHRGNQEQAGFINITVGAAATAEDVIAALRDKTDLPLAAHATLQVMPLPHARGMRSPATRVILQTDEGCIDYKTGSLLLVEVEKPRHRRG